MSTRRIPAFGFLASRRSRNAVTPPVHRLAHTAARERLESVAEEAEEHAASSVVMRVDASSSSVFAPLALDRIFKPAWHRGSVETMKDAILISLDALSQSSDAFPPLKSAVGGLLFIVAQIELFARNMEHVRDLYTQINEIVASLVRAMPNAAELSPEASLACQALSNAIDAVCKEIETITRQRPVLRFLRGKRHSAQLQGLAKQLSQADAAFARAMLVGVEAKITQNLACTQDLREDFRRFWPMTAVLVRSHRLPPGTAIFS